jgi:hypothetical protein
VREGSNGWNIEDQDFVSNSPTALKQEMDTTNDLKDLIKSDFTNS